MKEWAESMWSQGTRRTTERKPFSKLLWDMRRCLTRAERILGLSKDQENGKWGEGDKETHQQDILVQPSGHSKVCTRHTKRATGKGSDERGRRRRVVTTALAADQLCRQQGCLLCSTGEGKRSKFHCTEVAPCIEEHVKRAIEKDRKLSISVRRVTQPSQERANMDKT